MANEDWAKLALAALGGGALVTFADRFRSGQFWWDRNSTTTTAANRNAVSRGRPVRRIGRPVRQQGFNQATIDPAVPARRALPSGDPSRIQPNIPGDSGSLRFLHTSSNREGVGHSTGGRNSVIHHESSVVPDSPQSRTGGQFDEQLFRNHVPMLV